ncbi:MAG TPA: hypothetical protein VGH98_26100 [Gemmatimonadaceae bacterium]
MTLMQGPPFPPGMIPPEAVKIVQSFFITIAVIALGIPIIRAFTRRLIDRPPAAPPIPADVQNRLERIEQAVEAVAIEVERISESQRYITKLMAEPRALPSGRGSANA